MLRGSNMKRNRNFAKQILSVLLFLAMLLSYVPVTAHAAEEAPDSCTEFIAYQDGISQYMKYGNYLYQITYTNLVIEQIKFVISYDYLSIYRTQYKMIPLRTDDGTVLRRDSLPKTEGSTLNCYTQTEDYANDTGKPIVLVSCLAVNEPVWSWEGTSSAKATFTASGADVCATVDADVSTSTVAASDCTEITRTTATASVTFNGKTHTDTITADGEAGPHSFLYSASGDTLTETCANPCGHRAEAALTASTQTYTGAEIEGAEIVYGEDWAGIRPAITYRDNIDAGIATASAAIGDQTISTKFTIDPAPLGSAQITFDPDSAAYSGSEQKPGYTVTLEGFGTLAEGTDYTAAWSTGSFTAAGDYRLAIIGQGNFTGTAANIFGITQKEIAIAWSGTQYMPYTGQLVLPEASATGLASGDTCEVIVSLVETTEGAGINPGEWTARITGLSNGNYKLPENSDVPLEVKYTIYAIPEAPVISGVNETIRGKNDGCISGLTTEMEFASEPTSFNSAYTKVTDPNMSFAPGTYYVRYASKEYHYASPYTEVTVGEGRKLTVTLPQDQVGYTLTTTTPEMDWYGSLQVEFRLLEGYTMLDGFEIYDGNKPMWRYFNPKTGVLQLNFVGSDFDFTVEGVADITAPAAEIQLGEHRWNRFWNGITFGLFFRNTQNVTVTASDTGSGVEQICYYLSDRELSSEEVKTITAWQEYNGTFQINPDHNYVIYAKAADKAGNITYINSDGVVLDSIAPVISGIENGATYYTTQKVTVTDDNPDTVTVNGTEVTGEIVLNGRTDTVYTVTATDMSGNATTVTVTMKPIRELAKATENLSQDNVTSDNAPALQELIETLDELIADPDITDDGERETLEQHKVIAESLLETITAAAGAANTESTEQVSDVTAENVTAEDQAALEQAKADLEKALEDHGRNYTVEEKEAMEDEIRRIDSALEVIGAAAAVEELIGKIPETVTKNEEAAIKEAEDAYNALTDHGKTVVDPAAKKALDDAKAALAALNRPTGSTSPTTGDGHILWLWLVLLLFSGMGIFTMVCSARKRKSAGRI